MNFKLSDLVSPLTRQQCLDALYSILDTIGAPTTNFKKGGIVATILYVFAVMFAYATLLIAGIATSGFLDLAEGVWLTIKARYDYNVERLDASFAATNVVLTNASNVPYTVDAYDLTVSASTVAGTPEYWNTAAFVLPAKVGSTPGTATVPVQSKKAGKAYSAESGKLDHLVSSLAGVTVTNPQAAVGLDVEEDDSLRTRAKASAAALSPNGPSQAYEYAAKTATRASGENVGVKKVRIYNDSMGGLYVVAATGFGAVPGTTTNLSTDLGRVTDNVQRNASTLGITLHVQSAVEKNVTVAGTLYIYSDVNQSADDIKATCGASLSALIDRLPIGGDVVSSAGYLYADAIKTAIMEPYAPKYAFKYSPTLPGGDVALAVNEVVKLQGFNLTVQMVPRPQGAS